MSRDAPFFARLARPPGPRTVRGALVASLIGLWVIVPSGAAVRLTASGLGCPDYPLCEGNQVLPASSAHGLIEGGNRLLSALVMLVAVTAWVLALRAPGTGRTLRFVAGIAGLGTVAQVPLGAITVLTDLHPIAVGAHFLLSMVALAAGTVAVVLAYDLTAGLRRTLDRARAPLAGLAVLAGAATLVTGVLVTAAGPHSGDREVIERFGVLPDAAYVHVRAAIGFAVLALVMVAWTLVDPRSDRSARALSIVLAPALLAQIALGEYQWRNELPVEAVGAHVSLGALAWAILIGAAMTSALPSRTADTVTMTPADGRRREPAPA